MKIRESALESKIVEYAKRRGILTYKFKSPAQNGVPDRIFIGRGGVVLFMEVKRPGEKPEKLQEFVIDQMLKQGANVEVCDNFDAAQRILVSLE